MDNNQNWWRQLMALVLVSTAKATVEFLTNPGAREETTKQLRSTFSEIDYDALAHALTKAIDEAASTSKSRLNEAIDTLRDRSLDAVDEAKDRAEKQLGQKRGGRKMRFFFGLLIGGVIAYFLFDEQRRDELLDRLTGASGPIQQSATTFTQQASTAAQQAAAGAQDAAATAANTAAKQTEQAANKAETTAEKVDQQTSAQQPK